MAMPLVNQFLIPYEVWSTRPATQDDRNARLQAGQHISTCFRPVRVSLLDTINTPDKAVSYLANRQYHVQIGNRVTTSLEHIKSGYTQARNSMPSATPLVLSEYQRLYGTGTNMNDVNNSIISAGDYLADGQTLFHGGGILNFISPGNSLVTSRPFSTSFCPVKSLNNGAWRGKYYREGEANLIILTVKSMSKRAFVFRIKGTDKGYEKEVLIESNAKITVTSKTLLSNDYEVSDSGIYPGQIVTKKVPFYMIKATIS